MTTLLYEATMSIFYFVGSVLLCSLLIVVLGVGLREVILKPLLAVLMVLSLRRYARDKGKDRGKD